MAEEVDDSRPLADLLVYSNHFDQPYLAYSYTPRLNYTFDYCFNRFDSSIEIPFDYIATLTNSTFPAPTSATEEWTNLDMEPINRTNHLNLDFFNITTLHNAPCSPQNTWTTLSVCGDVPAQVASQKVQPRISPSPSSSDSLKRDFPCPSLIPINEPTPKRPATRKRGRPRLHRKDSSSSAISNSSDETRTHRLIHNQVERKYRNGLNAGVERLRRAVPTLPQGKDDATLIQARPSKLTVLAGAIEYIERIEQERDAAVEKLDYLRGCMALHQAEDE